jgi:hypothetical protein
LDKRFHVRECHPCSVCGLGHDKAGALIPEVGEQNKFAKIAGNIVEAVAI